MARYLDFNATTPLEKRVVDVISSALKDTWANPSSQTDEGRYAKGLVEKGRGNVAKMIGAVSSDIVFTSGGTEANNWVITSIIRYWGNTGTKPHVVTTNVEHDAIKKPLMFYEEHGELEVTFVPVCKNSGQVIASDIIAAVKPNTCLVTVMLANNETGVIMPIQEISKALSQLKKERQIFFHSDAAQAIGKIEVDVEALGVDYLTIVGHKFYGPRIGALYVKGIEDKRTPLIPLFFGGGQERGFRPGTENVPMVAGLGEAADIVCENISHFKERYNKLRQFLEAKLKETFGKDVKVHYEGSPRLPNTCNVSFRTSLTGGEILSRCRILQASTGAACHGIGKVSEILMASGVNYEDAKSSVRLSLGRETSEDDIIEIIHDLRQALAH